MDSTANDFFLTGVQLEIGPVATPFERRPIGTEFALCQRYFQTASFLDAGYVVGGATLARRGFFVPLMRATPTVAVTASSNTNTTGAGFAAVSSSVYSFEAVGAAAGGYIYSATANFSAEI
ncbi:MAG: hypothetical protein FJY48_13360 [Betaproteobacteria bacterium]|nr:hypothetical protein [Betaproteobacteria bacterium]